MVKAMTTTHSQFENNEDALADHLEECEIRRNADVLSKRYKESEQSGFSSIAI